MDDKHVVALLVVLATLDEHRLVGEHALERHAERGRHLQELLAEYEQDAADAQATANDCAEKLAQLDINIRDSEAALVAKRQRLAGIGDARQGCAIERELSLLASQIGVQQEEAAVVLGEWELAEQAAAVSAAALEEQRERSHLEMGRLENQALNATQSLPELRHRLARVITELPETIARRIRKLRANGGAATARLQGLSCGGCSAQLPVQKVAEVTKGCPVVCCPSCSCFVVHDDWQT